MSLLAQHGWGKSEKIITGLTQGLVQGVVMSPRDESPANMDAYLRRLRLDFQNAVLLLDPQFYASQVTPARDGNLPDYSYYRPNLTRRDFLGASKFQRYVRETLDYQYHLPLTAIVSPTVMVTGFNDSSSQIALQLAEASCDHHRTDGTKQPLYVSLLVHEQALTNTSDMNAFLDALTLMEADGFYLLLHRASDAYTQAIDDDRLAAWMYVVHILTAINDFDTYCGYSDLLGLMLIGAGATGIATGWHNGLRHFTMKRFRKTTGGSQARLRYTSNALLNSILLTELDQAFEANIGDEMLSGTPMDEGFSNGKPLQANWNKTTETFHHWASIQKRLAELATDVDARLDQLSIWIKQAVGTLGHAKTAGVEFETSFDHLQQWERAIRNFREML